MILVVGNINYDILLPLGRLPEPHEKLECSDVMTGFGGSGANTAWWLAKMGLPVTLAGAVGTDLFGQTHLAELESAGVLVSGVDRVEGTSGLAVIFSSEREKRMIRAPGANLHGKVYPELLERCRLVYLSGVNTPLLAEYAGVASIKRVPVVCGWHGALLNDVARAASGFILNADEAEKITGLGDPEDSIAALDADFAAVTLPTGGCVVSRRLDVQVVHAPELVPVDRAGGGDAFAAAFMAGFYQGKDVVECAEMGNRLSAGVIMERGARPEISIPEELKLSVKC
jgi:ribokinase